MVAVPSIGRASEVTPRRAAPEADATRELYERYARQIYTYCLHQLGNREEAEDAVQSTFLNAFRGYQRGVDPEFESAWLYKIAQNVCLTRQRSSSRRRRVETASDLDAMQDYVPAHEIDADELINLPEALDAMPDQQRKALLLREWQGLSYKEIAEELGLSQGAVETLLFRARRTLAAELSEEPAKKSALHRLRAGGDAGSALALLKSLLFTGGAKVVTAVATVAATSVVAAAPTARHAVEDVVTPGHDTASAPVHQVARKPESGGAPASSRVLVPLRRTAAPATIRPVVAKGPVAHHRAKPASALRPHDSHAAVPTPASVVHAPAPVDAPAPPAPAAPATPVVVDQQPARPAPAPAPDPASAPPAPAAAQPAAPPAPEKAKGDEKKNDANQPSQAPASSPAPDSKHGDGGNGGNSGRATSATATPPAAPPSPPADDQAPKSNGNGNGHDHGKSDNHGAPSQQVDVPPASVAAPAPVVTTATTPPAPATTTTTATTTAAAPTPAPPAASQPAAAGPQPTPPPTDNGNGNGNGGNGRGEGHRK